jgi:hypothetical protein
VDKANILFETGFGFVGGRSGGRADFADPTGARPDAPASELGGCDASALQDRRLSVPPHPFGGRRGGPLRRVHRRRRLQFVSVGRCHRILLQLGDVERVRRARHGRFPFRHRRRRRHRCAAGDVLDPSPRHRGHEDTHIGPTAEDFHDAFGLGARSTHIGTVDIDGVALAAIQGLNARLEAKERELSAQRAAIDALTEKLRQLEERIGDRAN